MEYPKGAFKNIEEFQAYFRNGTRITYKASRKYSKGVPTEGYATGIIIKKFYPDGKEYVGYEYKLCGVYTNSSCLDAHLIGQNYNDWFLFANLEDAKAYLKGVAF